MINYYNILGIPTSAGDNEIKAAFRKLAKLYHPDKNPNGQEEFKKILKAYEVLKNPSAKAHYDNKLNYHKTVQKPNSAKTTKKWSFEEREMQRRKYYDEHIKKHAKTSQTKAEYAAIKTNYNEYKYILYATPIAVALFLLVISLATDAKPTALQNNLLKEIVSKETLKMGDSPYTQYFGTAMYHMKDSMSLIIKNNSGADIIVCMFTNKSFIRSCFVKDGVYAEIPQLPKTAIELRYMSGNNWKTDTLLKEANVYGAFTNNLIFYKNLNNDGLGALNEITILGGLNEGFVQINSKEFFNKKN